MNIYLGAISGFHYSLRGSLAVAARAQTGRSIQGAAPPAHPIFTQIKMLIQKFRKKRQTPKNLS